MSEIKLRALSINFIESLISRWDDDFQGLQLKKFIVISIACGFTLLAKSTNSNIFL